MIQQVKLVSISPFPWVVVVTCKLYRPHETLEDNCRRQSAVKTLSPPFKTRARKKEVEKKRWKEVRERAVRK